LRPSGGALFGSRAVRARAVRALRGSACAVRALRGSACAVRPLRG